MIIGRNNSRVIFFFPAKHHACAASYIIAGQQPLTATQGQDVGIVCADIIALRKIEVESTDYALRASMLQPGSKLKRWKESDGRKMPQTQAVTKIR